MAVKFEPIEPEVRDTPFRFRFVGGPAATEMKILLDGVDISKQVSWIHVPLVKPGEVLIVELSLIAVFE